MVPVAKMLCFCKNRKSLQLEYALSVKILALLPRILCVSLVTTLKYNPCGEIFVSLLPKYGSNRNRYGHSGFVLAQSDHIRKPNLQGLDNMNIFIPSLLFVFTELSSKARCEVYL